MNTTLPSVILKKCAQPRARKRARHLMLAGLLGVAAAVSVLDPIAMLGAQTPPPSKSGTKPPAEQPAYGNRRFKYLGIGVAIGAALAFGYYEMSSGGSRAQGCEPKSCALPYLTASGGIAGLFLAHEVDAQRRAETPRTGASLTFALREFAVPASPTALGISDSVVVVLTDSGAQTLAMAPHAAAVQRRGSGLSDLRAVGVGSSGTRLLIGTGTALWETPLTAGLLRRMVDGPVDALSASGDVVVSASGRSIRINRGGGSGATIDSIVASASITSVSHDRTTGHWWLTSDSVLYELKVDGEKPELTSRATVSGQARAVASNDKWVAVALGGDGVAVWPRSAFGGAGIVAPMELRGEPRMAFDLAFAGSALYVAGGVDGVYQIRLEPELTIVGASRQVGYATSIVSDGTVLWVADRSRNRVLRMVP